MPTPGGVGVVTLRRRQWVPVPDRQVRTTADLQRPDIILMRHVAAAERGCIERRRRFDAVAAAMRGGRQHA
jgi:hypothetical protein